MRVVVFKKYDATFDTERVENEFRIFENEMIRNLAISNVKFSGNTFKCAPN